MMASSAASATSRIWNSTQQLLCRTVKRFRGGLVLKAHRLLYHSTLGVRAIQKRRRRVEGVRADHDGFERRLSHFEDLRLDPGVGLPAAHLVFGVGSWVFSPEP